MEKSLKDELRIGENVLWSAQPETFETLDVTHKKAFITKTVLVCGIAVLLSIIYVVFALNKGIPVKYALVALLIAGAVIASLNSLSDGKKLRKCTYVITDQRLLTVGYQVRSVEYSSIKEAVFKADDDGHMSLLCGKKAIASKPQLWRMFALSSAHMEEATGLCELFVFYAVPDAERVKKILKDYIPV